MSEEIAYSEVQVGDTIKVTIQYKPESAVKIVEGVAAEVSPYYIYDGSGEAFVDSDDFSDYCHVASIELLDRPKPPVKVGDTITLEDFLELPGKAVGRSDTGYVVYTEGGEVYMGKDLFRDLEPVNRAQAVTVLYL